MSTIIPLRWRRIATDWPALLTLLALLPVVAQAQFVLPPGAVEQFQHTVGGRVEALTILGGDYGAAGGFYTFRGGSKADLKVAKMGGGGIIANPRALGESDIKWAPVLLGNLGSATTDTTFVTGDLAGNRSVNRITAIQGGVGVRLYFGDNLTLTPTIGAIYSTVENEFKPANAFGDAVKAAAKGTFVDWNLTTWTTVPGLELQYALTQGRTTFTYDSRFTYFHTKNYTSTSTLVKVTGDSRTWTNLIDVDVPLGTKLYGRELHTGGFFSRTEIAGGAAQGMNENHIYTTNGRLVLDIPDRTWHVRWIGLGVSYFWGSHFDGWSVGADMRFQF